MTDAEGEILILLASAHCPREEISLLTVLTANVASLDRLVLNADWPNEAHVSILNRT